MTRVAVVTGGTRGIGEAISLKLKESGRMVIANYGGNDVAAKQFSVRSGIAVSKWDVGDHKSCIDACAFMFSSYRSRPYSVSTSSIARTVS